MTSELELKAAEAWHIIVLPRPIFSTITVQEPMPFGVALDYIQDITGDRDEAVAALLWAASNQLEKNIPEDLVNLRDEAIGLLSDIRGEYFSHADRAAETISYRAQDAARSALEFLTGDRSRLYVYDKWRVWAAQATVAIQFARDLVAAAYPEPLSPKPEST